MKPHSALLATAVVVCLTAAAACGSGRQPAEDELIYYCARPPDQLVPILTINEEARHLCELVFDGLVNKTVVNNGREEYAWALVAKEGYREQDPVNRRSITIYLRAGVLWHDGREFTADDVLYTFNAIKQSDSPLKGWVDSFVERVEAVEGNNYKIRLQLKVERSPEAFQELMAPIKILPCRYTYQGQSAEMPLNLAARSPLADEFRFRPTGTGRFRVAERSTTGRIALEANNDPENGYFQIKAGSPATTVKSLRVEVEPDPLKRATDLRRSFAIDLDVKPQQGTILQDAPLGSVIYLPYSFHAIVYNTGRPPFDQMTVRTAVTRATDRAALAERYLPGYDTQALRAKMQNQGVFPTASGYVQSDPESFPDPTPFSTAQAKALLGSGARPRGFELLICPDYDGAAVRELGAAYGTMMAAIGIDVQVVEVTAAMFDKRLRDRNFEAAMCQFGGFDHFFDVRSLFGDGPFNYSGIRDAKLESLLQEFGQTLDWTKRVALAKAISLRVHELSPSCPLFTVPRRAYYSNRLTEVYIHPEVSFSTIERWRVAAGGSQ